MFELEQPRRYRLARPPLVEALVDIRYPVRPALQSVEGIAPIQARLEAFFPYMTQEQVQQIQMQIGPGIQPAVGTSTDRIWRFTDDLGWVIVVAPDRATLAVGAQYERFSDFADRFRELLVALREAGVNRCDRLGLKYLDVAPIPEGEDGWRTWFRPELTGWVTTDILSDDATLFTSINQTQLSAPAMGDLATAPADIVALLKHGLVPPGSIASTLTPIQPFETAAFLLDIDIFVAAQQPFEPERLVHQATAFHDQMDRFFYWALADDGKTYFGLEEVDDD
jgi:uncharacterized protein (TIGR04255 family)